MNQEMTQIQGLIREILGEDYLELWVDRFVFEESVRTHEGSIRCELHHKKSGEGEVIEGNGVGVIHAFFSGLKAHLALQYSSLNTIQFTAFTVRGDMDSGKDSASSDAVGTVLLEVKNSSGSRFGFDHRSRSVAGSAVVVTLKAAEYFVNSERAFVQSYKALQNARERSRQDLVDIYTAHLAELVKNTSYSQVIDDIKSEWGNP